MELRDAVVIVTGSGSGIGAALARRFAAEGAAAVVVSDRDGDAAARVADEIGGTADATDVSDETAVAALVERTLAAHSRIDLFCSNAGAFAGGGVEVATETWQQVFAVNVLSHVYAARAVLPSMLERGSGYLLNVASAAGLLTTPGDAPYTVTKHGAVALAEWLAVTYGDRGIKVSAVCPLGVATPLLLARWKRDAPRPPWWPRPARCSPRRTSRGSSSRVSPPSASSSSLTPRSAPSGHRRLPTPTGGWAASGAWCESWRADVVRGEISVADAVRPY